MARFGLKASHTPNREGDTDAQSLSWKTAKDAASTWLGTFRLGRDLAGQTIDLSKHGDTLPFTGEFRRMVLQAVREKLTRRGARDIILPL